MEPIMYDAPSKEGISTVTVTEAAIRGEGEPIYA